MKLQGFIYLLSLTNLQSSGASNDSWKFDGTRSCEFDADLAGSPTQCMQYHKIVVREVQDGRTWKEYQWMWKNSKFEVQYFNRVGLLGVSRFTIGEVVYRNVGSPTYTKSEAVSFARNREELVIGIPGDDYQFAMRGAL